MFRHDHVAHRREAVAHARLFQNRQESIAAARRTEERQSPIARAGDKVQVMSAVSAMQTAGHGKAMVSAASHPPLQKAQGRGTHRSGTGRKTAPERLGHAPRLSL